MILNYNTSNLNPLLYHLYHLLPLSKNCHLHYRLLWKYLSNNSSNAYILTIDSFFLEVFTIASRSQTAPTTHTFSFCRHIFDYFATFPTSTVQFHASNVVLHVDSDAIYLVVSYAKSHVVGFFQLNNTYCTTNPSLPPKECFLVELIRQPDAKLWRHSIMSSVHYALCWDRS